LPATQAHDNKYNEIWGLAQNGREYAVIGSTMGTHIFDITNTQNVDTAAFIPGAATGDLIIHRDFHDYNGFLYIVSDENQGLIKSTLQIVDLSFLPDSAPIVYDENTLFERSHNIFIDSATARLYVCGVRPSGNRLEIYALDNPVSPVLIETYNRGRHDIFVRNDTAYLNDGFSGIFLVDFETPGNPLALGSLSSYIDSGYNHSGWLSNDGNVYALADETFGMAIKLLDVSDPANMSVISTMDSGVDTLSTPHNLIIKGDSLYVSYYNDGFYIFDISDPANPTTAGYFRTSTEPHIDGNYRGAWGVYPFLPSGLILISDMQNGLFVLQPTVLTGVSESEFNAQEFAKIHPNPFNEVLVITITNRSVKMVTIEIFNEIGQLVAASVERSTGGEISIDTSHLTNGLYQVNLRSKGFKESHKLIKAQ